MIQRTFDVKSESELSWLAGMKFFCKYTEVKTVFAQFYLSRFSAKDAQKVLDSLHREIPQLKIVGMSLYGDPFVGLNTEKLMRFNFCFFDESEVTVLDYDGDKMAMNEIVADFQKNMSQIEDAKGVLLLGSGITFKASRFMDEVTRGYEDIPFFGSIANINTADGADQAPYAFGNTMIHNGMVAAIFSGKNLHFYTESLFSWKPIGKEMRVEAGTPGDVGDSLIKTIDGVPATQIYKKYLDVEPDAHFVSNICEFPIVVKRNGYLMARVPCGFNEAGGLNMMGDVRDGEYIRFTYGKASEILEKTETASERMRDFSPQAIFLYACANRAIFLKDCAHEEIDFYGRIVSDLVYCHGFSELYRYKGQGGVFNSQLVTIGLREGEALYCNLHRPVIPGISFDNPKKHETHSHVHRDFSEDFGEMHAQHAGGLHSLQEQREQNSQEGIEATTDSGFDRQIGISIPITERLVTFLEATTNELREATRAANAANEAKSAFLSNMSHEIRSPINAVLGLDEMILRESNEQAIKGYARDIQSSGKSLLSIINDILDFSKIEAGKMEIIPDNYDLRSTITDLVNMIESRAEGKGLKFIVSVDETMPHLLYGDETRIKQCALNILTNAVKYTPSGSVTLTVSSEKLAGGSSRGEAVQAQPSPRLAKNLPREFLPASGSLPIPLVPDKILLKISVADTGIGIKEEDLEKLYNPFERIEENRNRSIEGTGLGMSIVNGLLSQMGTQLDVKSEYGKGSTFSFTVEQTIRDWEKIGTREESQKALLKEAASYSESFQAPEAKILVIDDTPVNLTVVKGLLCSTKIQIDTALSGEEALQLVRKNEYDILFVDHLMPKMDGIEFLVANFTDSVSINKNTPAVALTANAISGAKELYLSAGFTDYLSKPIDSKKLEEMIARLLPKEKLILPGDMGFIEEKQSQTLEDSATYQNDTHSSDAREQTALSHRHAEHISSAFIKDIFGLDIEDALKNCGGKEVFLEAARNFSDSIEENANLIEAYAASSDWKNYTILVHALKSSARLIGATELSELAKELEAAGNAADSGKIAQKTPQLLSDYRSFLVKLAPLVGNPSANASVSAQSDIPAISEQKFTEAVSAIKEVVSVFDFDTADAIIKELDSYSMTEAQAQRFKKLKKAVRDVDAAAVLKLC